MTQLNVDNQLRIWYKHCVNNWLHITCHLTQFPRMLPRLFSLMNLIPTKRKKMISLCALYFFLYCCYSKSFFSVCERDAWLMNFVCVVIIHENVVSYRCCCTLPGWQGPAPAGAAAGGSGVMLRQSLKWQKLVLGFYNKSLSHCLDALYFYNHLLVKV